MEHSFYGHLRKLPFRHDPIYPYAVSILMIEAPIVDEENWSHLTCHSSSSYSLSRFLNGATFCSPDSPKKKVSFVQKHEGTSAYLGDFQIMMPHRYPLDSGLYKNGTTVSRPQFLTTFHMIPASRLFSMTSTLNRAQKRVLNLES